MLFLSEITNGWKVDDLELDLLRSLKDKSNCDWTRHIDFPLVFHSNVYKIYVRIIFLSHVSEIQHVQGLEICI